MNRFDAYVIWCRKYGSWWGPGRRGYTPDLLSAGVYTREQADACAESGVDEVRSLQAALDGRRDAAGTVAELLVKGETGLG